MTPGMPTRVVGARWRTVSGALAEGLTDTEFTALEDQDAQQFDRRTWAALAWADARTRADLGPVPVEFEDELARHYSPAERKDLDLVTTVMTIANRSANTFDALIGRLRGQPVPGSRLLDELLVGTRCRCVDPADRWVPSARNPRRLMRGLRSSRAAR
jgi:hypothetical protein